MARRKIKAKQEEELFQCLAGWDLFGNTFIASIVGCRIAWCR